MSHSYIPLSSQDQNEISVEKDIAHIINQHPAPDISTNISASMFKDKVYKLLYNKSEDINANKNVPISFNSLRGTSYMNVKISIQNATSADIKNGNIFVTPQGGSGKYTLRWILPSSTIPLGTLQGNWYAYAFSTYKDYYNSTTKLVPFDGIVKNEGTADWSSFRLKFWFQHGLNSKSISKACEVKYGNNPTYNQLENSLLNPYNGTEQKLTDVSTGIYNDFITGEKIELQIWNNTEKTARWPGSSEVHLVYNGLYKAREYRRFRVYVKIPTLTGYKTPASPWNNIFVTTVPTRYETPPLGLEWRYPATIPGPGVTDPLWIDSETVDIAKTMKNLSGVENVIPGAFSTENIVTNMVYFELKDYVTDQSLYFGVRVGIGNGNNSNGVYGHTSNMQVTPSNWQYLANLQEAYIEYQGKNGVYENTIPINGIWW